MTINIHSTYKLGPITLRNRAVMSPMTRSRAIGNVPNALMATYYGQRAGDAGLIITEGTSPSPNGLGYPRIPGLFNAEHVAGWKGVTSAVHAKGGRIFVQLMHTGRVANTGNLPPGARVLAPSAIVIDQQIWVDPDGNQPVTPAHEMSAADIEHAIGEHVHAGKLAIEAGFDGVELHGANGYLIEQFLNSTSNHRADDWGGSIEKRCKFGFEIAQRLAAAIGGERVGIRMSPYGVNGGIAPDPDVETSYPRFAGLMKRAGLAYVHVADHSSMGAPAVSASVKANIRKEFGGTIILAGGYDLAHANADLAEGKGELVAFGRNYLANPTYLARASKGEALNAPDFTTLYSPGEKGYTDYV
jgi:N-ethylmaleimide reductase